MTITRKTRDGPDTTTTIRTVASHQVHLLDEDRDRHPHQSIALDLAADELTVEQARSLGITPLMLVA